MKNIITYNSFTIFESSESTEEIKQYLYDVKKYMDTILSVNDYCLSVGFYIYCIWVGSGISREDYNLLEFEKAVSNDKCNKAPIIIMIRQK